MRDLNEQEIRDRVLLLLEQHYEEGLDGQRSQEFNVLLRNSDAARDAYLSFTYLHGALNWRAANRRSTRPNVGERESVVYGQRRPFQFLLHRPVISSIAIAAIVMGLLIAGMMFIAAPAFRDLAQSAVSKPTYVADLTGVYNLKLGRGVALPIGSSLEIGRCLQVDEGLAEITYHNGAKLILQGPAKFRITDAASGRLESGRVTAHVPLRAIGFTINTPLGAARDMGTHFGVYVAGKRDACFAVFNGRVEVQLHSHVTPQATRVLSSGETLHVSGRGIKFDSTTNIRDHFVMELPDTKKPSEFEVDSRYVDAVIDERPFAYWRFEQFQDDRVQSEVPPYFELHRVGRVADVPSGNSNRIAAFLPGSTPSFLIGDQSLTTQLNQLDNEVTLIAWILTGSNRHQAILHQWGGGMAISLEICGTQLGFVLNFENHDPVHLATRRTVTVGRWVMLAGVYDGKEMRIYEDGQLLARQEIPAGVGPISADTHRMYLGRRSDNSDGQFSGALDEVAIFAHALSETQIQRLFQIRSTVQASSGFPSEAPFSFP